MNENDFTYPRNINTSPGPNAGRSIDPTKSGPDADRIAELGRKIRLTECWADIPARNARLMQLRAELARFSNEQPKGDAELRRDKIAEEKFNQSLTSGPGSECDRSGAAPSPEPQDVREALRNARAFIEHATFNVPLKERLDAILLEIYRALKDPSPPNARETADAIVLALCDSCNAYFDNFDRAVDVVAAALAQSDAQPVGWNARQALLAAKRTLAAYQETTAPHVFVGDISLQKVHELIDSTLTAPHRPDASGLIEAAEFLKALADEMSKPHPTDSNGNPLVSRVNLRNGYRESAKQLRARAADRSAPRSDKGGA